MMKKLLKALVVAALLSAWAMAAQAQDIKIGFVDTQQVMREANPGKAAQMKLEAEFGKRGRELQAQDAKLRAVAEKFDNDAPTLSDAERVRRNRDLIDQKRELDRKGREFQEDLERRRGAENAALRERIGRVLKQIFDSEKYDLILQENVAFHSRSVDITKKVINALNAQK